MPEVSINKGDVVQIDPDRNAVFAGCFATVSQVGSWGIIATVLVPAAPHPGHASIRLEHGSFRRIGKAEWVGGPG